MWTRAELKERAKAAFKRNYWICVAAAFILSLLVGSSSGGSSGGSSSGTGVSDDTDSFGIMSDGGIMSDFENLFEDEDFDYSVEEDEDGNLFYDDIEEDEDFLTFMGIAGLVFVVIMLVVLVIAVVFSIFVGNVVEVGGCRFFTLNAGMDGVSLKELFSGFCNGNYLKNVSVQFFRGLYTTLWTLLFVIPGIVKSYEYRMIPYILADNPNVSKEEAFALSKRMMDGNKWNTFVLDLSFIGWSILSGFTCGILGLFYVDPYIRATDAELYLKLKSYVMPAQSVTYDTAAWDNAQVY